MPRVVSCQLIGMLLLASTALVGCAGGGSGGGGSGGGGPSSGGSAGGGGGGGGTGGGGTPPVASVPNPYALGGDTEPTRLGNLVVFGDSYSTPSGNRPGVVVWNNRLGADSVERYAQGGATATDEAGSNRTLRQQVSRWLGGGRAQAANDLAVVYMGHNDVDDGLDIGVALRDYGQEVDRILGNGAGSGDRKLFVTLIHDWSGTPATLAAGDVAATRGAVNRLNRGIVDIANDREDVVAVDLRTVFDRILDDPARFGLGNVTTADPAAADTTALYFDEIHFGNRGQDLIAQVFRHYLTRGWSWANTLSAGAEATARLQQDLDDGLVVSLAQLGPDQGLGFSTFTFGTDPATGASARLEEAIAGDPTRAAFAALHEDELADGGVGMAYALSGGTKLGMAFSSYDETAEADADTLTSRADVRSQAVSIYLDQKLAGIDIRTVLSVSEDRHLKQDYDAVLDTSHTSSFDGRTMALSTTASRTFALADGSVRPWLGLAHTRQQVDGFSQSNPYVSDVRYEAAEVTDTLGSLGLAAALPPVPLKNRGWLFVEGGISYTHGLAQDDYAVTMTEEATGFRQTETIARERTRLLGAHLDAELALGEGLNLAAGLGASQQLDGEGEQHARAGLSYRF